MYSIAVSIMLDLITWSLSSSLLSLGSGTWFLGQVFKSVGLNFVKLRVLDLTLYTALSFLSPALSSSVSSLVGFISSHLTWAN